jgi:FAD/FMN-containing dehydrogenase
MLTDLTPDVLAVLARDLPGDLFSAPEPRHLSEPRGRVTGRAGALARPRSVGEVSALVRACGRAGVGIVPWGGGTGLVLGQVAPEGPRMLLLSLERMRAVREVRADEDVLVAEAGVTLAGVQAAARDAGRLYPLSLASEGSATVGGTLGTNAGGIGVLRYGNARDLCLGVEAVLPDGSVLNGLKRLRKDNAGYDLRHLLIGSEGTLGVITAASLRLFPIPAGEGAALIAVPGPGAALQLLELANERMGGCVSAFELMHRQGAEFLAETDPACRQPWPAPPEWLVWIEAGFPAGIDPDQALAGLYEAAVGAGLAGDGLVAQGAAQRAAFRDFRERIPEANRRIGAVASHDISLPLRAVAEFIARAPGVVAEVGAFRINCFGHLGDGNLHWNVFPPKGVARGELMRHAPEIQGRVHDLAHSLGGSVSAEHGIGRLKVGDLERYGDPAKLAVMRAIKAALDPQGIMNPGAVLRAPA